MKRSLVSLGIGGGLGLWPWCHLAPLVIPLLDRGIHAAALMAGSTLIPLFQLIPLFPRIYDSSTSLTSSVSSTPSVSFPSRQNSQHIDCGQCYVYQGVG